MQPTTINTTTPLQQIIFNQSAAVSLKQWAIQHHKQRIFLVVSNTLRTTTTEITQIEKSLGSLHVGTWSGMRPHSPRTDVITASNQIRQSKADVLVTIGGGSLTDGAKAIVLCLALDLSTPKSMSPYRGSSITGSDANYTLDPTKIITLVCIPTTLSGGEFTPLAGVSDLSKTPKRKEGFSHPLLQPKVILYDPQLTRHTPEWLFLSTGIRAMDHCIEAICSIDRNTYVTGIAEAALSILCEGLKAVKKNPKDMKARNVCQNGVALASKTIRHVSFGASHAIGHVLGGMASVPHGYTSCVMLPAVLKWNANSALKNSYRCIHQAMKGHRNEKVWQVVSRFISDLNMPLTLNDLHMKDKGKKVVWNNEKLTLIAKYAMHDPWIKTNPKKINGYEDVYEMLQMVKGDTNNYTSNYYAGDAMEKLKLPTELKQNKTVKEELLELNYHLRRIHVQKDADDVNRVKTIFDIGMSYYCDPLPNSSPLKKQWKDYIVQAINDDLSDINQVYLQNGGDFWVIEDMKNDNSIVACVGVEKLNEKQCELRRMSVSPDVRRVGLGSMLVRQVEEFARMNCFEEILLSTGSPMMQAKELYGKNGFEKYKEEDLTSWALNEKGEKFGVVYFRKPVVKRDGLMSGRWMFSNM